MANSQDGTHPDWLERWLASQEPETRAGIEGYLASAKPAMRAAYIEGLSRRVESEASTRRRTEQKAAQQPDVQLRRVLTEYGIEPTVLEQIFKEKASIKGFSLKIILLHPDSMFLKKRAEVVFGSGTSGAYQSKKTLLILRNAFRLIQSNLVEVRTHNSLPSVFIVQCDDRALLVCISTRERLLRIHISKFAF